MEPRELSTTLLVYDSAGTSNFGVIPLRTYVRLDRNAKIILIRAFSAILGGTRIRARLPAFLIFNRI
jgi:hypothetical protein